MKAAGYRVFDTGINYGTITALSQISPNCKYEITTLRTDGTYSDNRHPDYVAPAASVEEDLARRDFTMNAIAWHPTRGLFDPYQGYADIKNNLIRCVGNPAQRFQEDALRILRASRFESQLGFLIEANTRDAMNEYSVLLRNVSAERLFSEITKLLLGSHTHDALINNARTLAKVIPAIEPCIGFDQQTRFHIYDVWEHIAYTVEYMPPTAIGRWAALLHDIGKPEVFFKDEEGRGHFYGHNIPSMKIARETLTNLKAPKQFTEDVCTLVYMHDAVINPTHKSVKRVLRKLNGQQDLFRMLMDLKRADNMAHNPDYQKRLLEVQKVEKAFNDVITAQEIFSLKDLAINGNDVLSIGFDAGPQVGAVLESALNAVIEERIENTRAALLSYAQACYVADKIPEPEEPHEDYHGRPVY